jgi:dTDP-4-dehydrorhamnose reductase
MLLLIGSNEELSQSLLTVAAKDQDVDFLDSDSFDVTNPESLNDAVRKVKPSIIVNCAVYPDFQGAESDRERAYALNSFLPRDLARLSLEYRCDFFHVSSTAVSAGKRNCLSGRMMKGSLFPHTGTHSFSEKASSRSRAVPGAS